MLRGLQGGPNEFMNRLDGYIEQDIREQQAEIDNKKAALHANQSMVGQLLQVTGDRRVAADVARRLMYESAKTDLAAKNARYGIPEAKAGVDLAMNAIDQKIATINAEGAKNAYEVALKQAAAAAAARKAAEKEAFDRSMKILEMGQKQDELEIKRKQASGESLEDLNKQTQALGKELGAKDLTEGRAAVENAQRRLQGLKPDEGLPGVGPVADIREKFGRIPVVGLSAQERVSRGDWEKIKLAYQHQITGSGASNEERAMLSKAFEGARTPAEQRNAIAQADDFFTRREDAIRKGFDPRAVKLYDSRGRTAMPSSVRVAK
jgi:hypothetical protein